MAEVKDKLVTLDALKTVHDSLRDRISLSAMGVEASAEEINYTSGVTSNIQEQFDDLSESINKKASTTYVDEEIKANSKAPTVFLENVIQTGWDGEEAPFTNKWYSNHIATADIPVVDVDLSSATVENIALLKAAWSLIDRISIGEQTDNGVMITAYSYTSVPEVDIPLSFVVYR